MRKTVLIGLAGCSLLWFSGCGGDSGQKSDSAVLTCSKVAAAQPQPGRQRLTAPTAKLPAGSSWDLRFTTNCGDFTVRVSTSPSPNAAASVVELAKSGFYDGLAFHRLAPGFVIQGGDPAGNGSGGPGYSTVDRPSATTTYPRGTVAMAKSGQEPPGTSGSQFFIVTGDDSQFTPDYAIIGKVISGLQTVDLIGSQPIDSSQGGTSDGPPADPIVIRTVKVSRVA